MKTAAPSNWHTIIDARSRDLHAIIAGKIRLHPSVLGQVCKTLARWLRAMDETDRGRDALVEWQLRVNDQPLDEVLEFMASEDEEACRLRQSSPFMGLLTEQERQDVFRKYEAFRS